ncbi:MAG: hypothetical protein U1D70_19510 [Methylobacter sp.]|nr:hypothetical protein [Methylobacter sp.]
MNNPPENWFEIGGLYFCKTLLYCSYLFVEVLPVLALEVSTITASPPVIEKDYGRSRRYKRLKVANVLGQEETGHRVGFCTCRMVDKAVNGMYNLDTESAYYRGVMMCGSVWDCPVCSAKVSMRRREEINEFSEGWYRQGGTVFMATFTMAHSIKDSLKEIKGYLTNAIRFVRSGEPYQRWVKRMQIIGTITATEITYGKNGWHFHKHVLFYTRLKTGSDTNLFSKWLNERYIRFLHGKGRTALPGIAVDVGNCTGDYEYRVKYVTRWGLGDELTSSTGKRLEGMTPFQFLDDDVLSEKFVEYSRAMFGCNRIVWSKGLREMVKTMKPEKTDEELASEEQQGSQAIVRISPSSWDRIVADDQREQLLYAIEKGGDDLRHMVRIYNLELLIER